MIISEFLSKITSGFLLQVSRICSFARFCRIISDLPIISWSSVAGLFRISFARLSRIFLAGLSWISLAGLSRISLAWISFSGLSCVSMQDHARISFAGLS
jgi:hypothetical protein